MDDFEITLKVRGTEESVGALTQYLEKDILAHAHSIKLLKTKWKYFYREVRGFNSDDIKSCAADHGYNELSLEEVNEVMDLMEKRFDADIGINWNVISICISDVI